MIAEFLESHIEVNKEELLSHLQGLSDSCLVALKTLQDKPDASLSETMASINEDYGMLMNSEYTLETLIHLLNEAEESEDESGDE